MGSGSSAVVYPSTVSVVGCTWALWRLLRLRGALRKRLFWGQISALVATDLVWALLGICLYGHGMGISPDACFALTCFRYMLEFASCLLEVQMAAGFAASCCHAVKATTVLRPAILLSWPCGCAIVMLMVALGLRDRLLNGEGGGGDFMGLHCDAAHEFMWSVCVICSCAAAVILYGVSFSWSAGAPRIVRVRALNRLLTYILNFVCTFGVRAVQMLLPHTPRFVEQAALCLLCLNGAVNAAVYLWQSRWSVRATPMGSGAHDSGSFHVGFQPSVDVLEPSFHDYFLEPTTLPPSQDMPQVALSMENSPRSVTSRH